MTAAGWAPPRRWSGVHRNWSAACLALLLALALRSFTHRDLSRNDADAEPIGERARHG